MTIFVANKGPYSTHIASEPGLTKIFPAVFLQSYDLALSQLTYPLNGDLAGG